MWGLGFGDWGLVWPEDWGLGFGVWDLGFGIWGFGGLRVWDGLGFGAWGLGNGVWGLGFGGCGLGLLGFQVLRGGGGGMAISGMMSRAATVVIDLYMGGTSNPTVTLPINLESTERLSMVPGLRFEYCRFFGRFDALRAILVNS